MFEGRRRFLKSAALAPLGFTSLSVIPHNWLEDSELSVDSQAKAIDRPTRDPGRSLDIALFFDVEDIFSPPELGNDDSIKQLADILTEEGVRANFLVIGERALSLRERRRQDVIDSLKPHDVGLHTRSAYHPEIPEYLAGKDWAGAVVECLKHEREGTEIIRDVFGKPCAALSSHYLYLAPHSQRVAALLGLPFVYAYPAAPPLYSLSWYTGALGLPWASPTLDNRPILSYFDGFDDKYWNTKSFDKYLEIFKGQIESCLAQGQPYLTVLTFHPQRLRNKDFIDAYWSPNGVNYPKDLWGKYGRPAQYTREQVETSLTNFRRIVHLIRSDPRLRIMTVSEIVQKYGKQPKAIPVDELLECSRQIVAAQEILIHERFSPGEILVGMARCIVSTANIGQMPNEVPREDILGPLNNPIWIPELQSCSYENLVKIAQQLLDHLKTTGHLPATLGRPLERVGINHLYVGFATACLALRSASKPEEVKFCRVAPWPKLGPEIGLKYFRAVEGELMDPDIDMYTLYRDGKLQSWTLKPASVG